MTDPYSVSLSRNSQRSQIVDLADPALKPAGWDALPSRALAAPEDIVLYELHVRDFSASDPTVPADLTRTFKAFTLAGSNGMRHLRALADAGPHATSTCCRSSTSPPSTRTSRSWQQPAGDLASYPPDSRAAAGGASARSRTRTASTGATTRCHYTVPEGSYATEPGRHRRASSSSARWSRRSTRPACAW